jgi:hypothetical protein
MHEDTGILEIEAQKEMEQEALLSRLQREMASYLAQKISFSLFEAGREPFLHRRIRELIDEKLASQHLSLEDAVKNRLFDLVVSGLPKRTSLLGALEPPPQDVPAEESLSLLTMDDLKKLVAPYLAPRIEESYFAPGKEAALGLQIARLIKEKLDAEQLHPMDQTVVTLIDQVCRQMGAEPPSALEAVTDKELSLQAIPQELKRSLLFFLATEAPGDLMATADRPESQRELIKILRRKAKEDGISLTESQLSALVDGVASGADTEFQL